MSSDPRDYKLDISGLQPPDSSAAGKPAPKHPRPWLSVQFDCCSVYQRIYRSADGTCYEGACPRCGGKVRFNVGAGGTSSRFFRVYR
jgi:hypothetical protein